MLQAGRSRDQFTMWSLDFSIDLILPAGRAIAEAVSRWLPTEAARVQSRVWSSGICGGHSGAGAGFLRVLRFPLPIFILPIAPQSPWGWYNRPVVAAVPSGLSLTPPKKKNPSSSAALPLGSTQPLTDMKTRNLPGGKERSARKADNLTTICEQIV
jgi:hypothetical protein